MSFDFSCVDWSDDDSSPFDQCEDSSECVSLSETSASTATSSLSSRTPTIRFAPEDEVFEIPHVKDYTPEDINATWYRPNEFREMRSQIQRVIFLMEHRQDLALESDTFTKRGLEFRTTEGSMKRTHQRMKANAAVLETQQRLWREGHEDTTEQIASAYLLISSRCAGMALLQGIQDQHDIRVPSSPSTSTARSTNISTNSTTSPDTTNNDTNDEEDDFWASPLKPYESETITSRRLAVLEDIKILSGASELEQWSTNPAAA